MNLLFCMSSFVYASMSVRISCRYRQSLFVHFYPLMKNWQNLDVPNEARSILSDSMYWSTD